jgi:hypothetical protein
METATSETVVIVDKTLSSVLAWLSLAEPSG